MIPEQTLNLTGKVALVSGAGVGIGKAVALALGQAGAFVGIHYHSSKAGAEQHTQSLAQIIDIGRACAQHFGSTGVVQQGQQQVFHGDELVALLSGLDEGHVQANF